MNQPSDPKGLRSFRQIEITSIPPLSPEEQSIVDFHSVLNVLNVLRSELMVIGDLLAGNVDLLKQSLALCDKQLGQLSDHNASLRNANEVDEFEQHLIDEITGQLPRKIPDPVAFAESMGNLQSVLSILKLRAREILARSAAPDRWECLSIDDITASLRQMFIAVAKNSKGRFRVIEDAALQTDRDYYIDLKFKTGSNSVYLPLVFVDVMRDLIANARKYTPPGGKIVATLHQDTSGTEFLVKDTGCGIPPAEIEHVVHCGKRASNVANIRTLGGGFGLTKAFLTTKQFGGKFWIGSELGQGTDIRIWLPPIDPALRETRPPMG